MKPAPRRWQLNTADALPGFHPILGKVLAGRGLDAAAATAFMDAGSAWHDPFALPGMHEAVATVAQTMREHGRIAVYGDYDADGVTACAMLTRTLRYAGADVLPYIPNRMTEGYGLHAAALEGLGGRARSCVIPVQSGTSRVQ